MSQTLASALTLLLFCFVLSFGQLPTDLCSLRTHIILNTLFETKWAISFVLLSLKTNYDGQLNTCSELFFLEILFKIHGNESQNATKTKREKVFVFMQHCISTELHVSGDNNPQLHS